MTDARENVDVQASTDRSNMDVRQTTKMEHEKPEELPQLAESSATLSVDKGESSLDECKETNDYTVFREPEWLMEDFTRLRESGRELHEARVKRWKTRKQIEEDHQSEVTKRLDEQEVDAMDDNDTKTEEKRTRIEGTELDIQGGTASSIQEGRMVKAVNMDESNKGMEMETSDMTGSRERREGKLHDLQPSTAEVTKPDAKEPKKYSLNERFGKFLKKAQEERQN